MKSTTVEGRAKTKNGVTRLVFSVICILLEVIFIILMFTKLNRYAEAVNLLTSCGRDRYFEYVCITGYLDDQSSLDPSDPHVPDHGTWTVSSGRSERWYRKDEEALSENRRTAFAAAPGEQKDSGKNFSRKFQKPEIFLPISTEMLRIRCIRIQM